ncbi:hypothetical protein [Pseudomonas syringae]|uniref:Uncharacterized protein n=2 Tax=Pseudomonas syringae TaxID=317 RepID=A0AAJ4E7N5_PSESX|nr:hypothetical protein [Pseudomonas syringae]AAY40009.1 hypothetical protein Psyr_4982 [Pseudomonas syringae pv. syringae B728a]PYD12955.1 hypothetical protein DND47_20450 [Pseudomonas syringae pv. syringae]QHF10783.1 hypothetical protein N026_26460 [Pseudomonas syringae UB303]
MIDSDKLKKFSWFLFVFLVSILALGLSSFKYFLPVYFTIFLCAITWTLYLVYVCESFTLYMTSLLVTIASIFCSFASLSAYLVATKFWGKASAPALMAGLAPFGITSLTYLLLVNGKPSFHPFEYDGIKVQPRPEKKQKKTIAYNPLLIAGATTLAASIFIKAAGALTAGMVAMFGLTTFSIALLFHARHIIRGLRDLRLHQKTMPTPYTFMQIDEIRKARRRWWLSRLFQWVASRRKSPGA